MPPDSSPGDEALDTSVHGPELSILVVGPRNVLESLTGAVEPEIGRVVTATSIDGAMAKLRSAEIDCVVSELSFGRDSSNVGDPVDRDGLQLLRAVRERDETLPFVLWTADGDEAVASEAIAAGVTEYVPRSDESGTGKQLVDQVVNAVDDCRGSSSEGYLRSLRDLQQQLSGTETIEDGLHTAVTDVCEVTEWEYGELWVPTAEGDRLVHAKSYALEEAWRDFVRITKTTSFRPGEGLPGRVWVTEDSEWIHDVSEQPPERYIRTEIAERSDFKAAYGVPVVADGRKVGVLAYYVTEPRFPDEKLRAVADSMAAALGQRIALERRGEAATGEVADRSWGSIVDSLPLVAIDGDDGDVLEVNDAFEQFSGHDAEALVGRDRRVVFPTLERDRDGTRALPTDTGANAVTEFADGVPIRVSTAEGDRLPVSIVTTSVSHDGTSGGTSDGATTIYCAIADASDRYRYRRAFDRLADAAADFRRAETKSRIDRTVLETATDLLEPAGVALYVHDEDDGELTPRAVSDGLAIRADQLPSVSPGSHGLWRCFAEQRAIQTADSDRMTRLFPDESSVRAQLLVPIGEYGVLVAGAADPGGLRADDEPVLTVLCGLAAAAVKRLDDRETISQLRANLRGQRRARTRADQLVDALRSVATVSAAGSREEIQRVTCDTLLEIDGFDGVWIGDPIRETETATGVGVGSSGVEPVAHAGVTESTLESFATQLGPSGEDTDPATDALADGTAVVESSLATAPREAEWRRRSLLQGYQAVCSVPIRHEQVSYGTLTVLSTGPDRFDERTAAILEELGSVLGYAYASLDVREALRESSSEGQEWHQNRRLRLEIDGVTDAMTDLSSRLEADLHLVRSVPRDGNGQLHYVVIDGCEADVAMSEAAVVTAIDDVRIVADGKSPLLEVTVVDEDVPGTVAALGAVVQSTVVSRSAYRLDVSLPHRLDREPFVARLEKRYPEAEIGAYDGDWPAFDLGKLLLEDRLSARQRDVLEAAYHAGFFEQPRKSTGKEIAEALGISQPAFSKQLRAIQRRLLEPVGPDIAEFDGERVAEN
ncbi:GAF domain-containing protein [Halobiforma nitratireducens]|uniref:PAS domain S-box n=1 Tax=Halobiforma nitratireducens JCM 10879 TaxID=1227454 RepID=M0MMI7_9EURY|nr:GAF domain-containing protein [Halobiforma nitratireducens]EMA46907.1 PAS domain S-box [Halobiforma nitratireducens JCM 10879]